MEPVEILLTAIDRLRAEAASQLDDPAEFLERLDHYRDRIAQEPSRVEINEALLLRFTMDYPRAHERLVAILAELRGETPRRRSALRGSRPRTPRGAREMPRMVADEGPAPAGAGASQRVTRYTDITCPRRVWIQSERVAVTVRLTRQPVQSESSPVALQVDTSLPVHVRIDAPGFQVLGHGEQALEVPPDQDSPGLVFYLRPQEVTHTRVVLEFRQGGNLAGTASVEVEITLYPVESEPAVARAHPIPFEPDAPLPDRTLVIGYEHLLARPRLTFTLYEGTNLRLEASPFFLPGDLAAYVKILYQRLSKFADDAAGRPSAAQAAEAERLITQVGRRLWRDLIPPELKTICQDEWQRWQDSSLLIVSDEPYIPWELAWPYGAHWPGKDEPWCAGLEMTRWLRRRITGEGTWGPPARLRWQRLGCLTNMSVGLINVAKERELLRTFGQTRGLQLVPPQPETATTADALALLTGADFDWLHLATHGRFEEWDGYQPAYIALAGDDILTPDDLLDGTIEAHLMQTRPGFVFNTCHGGRQAWGLSGMGGWAEQLVGSGAGLFLAAQWSVTDERALAFSQEFYERLARPEPVGRAVRAARERARTVGDPSWLAYTVYGHPGAQVA